MSVNNITIDKEDTINYDELKDKVINWCTKLYQDGVYSYNQYQECLKNLDTGSASYYKYKDDNVIKDDGKDTERIYGYYKKGKEKVNSSTSNPINPIVKDDFEIMTLFHYKNNKFMISDDKGYVLLDSNPDIQNEKEWQLISLGKQDEKNVYAIRSKYGNFLLGSDDGSVSAENNIISTWCQWKLIKHNDNFAFKSITHKKYLSSVGDELILTDGWSDNNLWVMKKKEVSTGKHVLQFDNSLIILKKDTLLNKMNNSYNNAINHKYKRDYYVEKLKELNILRKAQLDYLLQIINEKIDNFNTENETLEKSKEKIERVRGFSSFSRRKIMRANIERTRKNNEIDEIIKKNNKEKSDLNLFNEEIKNNFNNLIEKQIQDLNIIITNNENKRLEYLSKFRKAEEKTNTFITVLANLNKNTEKEVQNLVNGLDIKLEKNIELSLKLSKNEPSKSFEDLSENINTNYSIVQSVLSTEKRNFFLSLIEIIFIIILFYLIITKIFNRKT
jgi:hypothetical protein